MKSAKVSLLVGAVLFSLSLSCGILGFFSLLPQKAESQRSDWMGALPSSTKIEQLSVPGTHDSLALYGIADLSGQCQSLPLKEQLHLGVRLLDVRLKMEGGQLRAVHSFIDQKQPFKTSVQTMEEFLDAHPNETLFVSIKMESTPASEAPSFEKLLKEYLSGPRWYLGGSMPDTLGEARGKAVLLSRYQDPSMGVNWYRFFRHMDNAIGEDCDYYLQDHYRVASIEEKKDAINRCFASNAKYRINYCSGYLDHSFPPSYAPSVAMHINPWLQTVFKTIPQKGFVFMDFITTELMDSFFAEAQA